MANIEAFIRKEVSRLDDITGFHAASLVKVNFNKSVDVIGGYHSYEYGEEFIFSLLYFGRDAPKEALLQVIRHEYAHYLAWHIFREKGHGTLYKECCRMIRYSHSPYLQTILDHIRNELYNETKEM